MTFQPVIPTKYKGMVVAQLFPNKFINNVITLSDRMKVDEQIFMTTMYTKKITLCIEVNDNPQTISVHSPDNKNSIEKYKFNNFFNVYQRDDKIKNYECLNIIEILDE